MLHAGPQLDEAAVGPLLVAVGDLLDLADHRLHVAARDLLALRDVRDARGRQERIARPAERLLQVGHGEVLRRALEHRLRKLDGDRHQLSAAASPWRAPGRGATRAGARSSVRQRRRRRSFVCMPRLSSFRVLPSRRPSDPTAVGRRARYALERRAFDRQSSATAPPGRTMNAVERPSATAAGERARSSRPPGSATQTAPLRDGPARARIEDVVALPRPRSAESLLARRRSARARAPGAPARSASGASPPRRAAAPGPGPSSSRRGRARAGSPTPRAARPCGRPRSPCRCRRGRGGLRLRARGPRARPARARAPRAPSRPRCRTRPPVSS